MSIPFRYVLPLTCMTVSVFATDWPQFLGPNRNGSYTGADVSFTWDEKGPARLWKVSVGRGFSGPVVSQSRLFLHQRKGDAEELLCLEADSGKTLWSVSDPTTYHDSFGFDDGPRATPTVAAGRIYTFGAEGLLTCRSTKDGTRVWQIATHKTFKVKKGFFGAACSPLYHEGVVIVNVGGKDDSGIVAFDAESGAVRWKATGHDASYSSPAVVSISEEPHCLVFTREGLVDLHPSTGKVRFEFPWRARIAASVNAATPLVDGDLVFITSSYRTGAACLRVGDDAFERLWSSDEAISSHYATPVINNGTIYGLDGRQEFGQSMRAVDVKSGKVLWTQEGFKAGTVSLIGAHVLLLTEDGELIGIKASPKSYQRVARATVASGTVRAFPALASGRLFFRSETELYAVDLRNAAGKEP